MFCLSSTMLTSPPRAQADIEPTVITVDTRQTVVKSFLGLGVQWDPYEYEPSPAAWQLTQKRLDFLKPAFVRVMLGAHTYCTGFAADGKPEYIWSQGEEATRKRLGTLLWILDYAQAHKITVLLGEWAPPGQVGDKSVAPIDSPGDPRWARIIADCVQWLRTRRGYSMVRMYNMMNEPNGDWMWPGGKVDYDAWATGIHHLRKELDARGLSDLPIVGPDNAWSWEWIDRVSQTMPQTIGAWEMHWYAADKEVLDGRIEELLTQKRAVVRANDPAADSKPFFLGEVGLVEGKTNGDQQPRVKTFPYGVFMADLVAQVGRAGWEGAIAWDLDDAMHSANGHAVPPTDRTLKVWGFWNTQGAAMGHPEDEAIRPWFTPWSLMTRLFPAGARLVTTTQPNLPGLRVLAAAPTAGKRLTVMIVNNSDESRDITVRVPGGGSPRLITYRYFDGERLTDADGFPLPTGKPERMDLEKGRSVSLPGRGVVFLTTESIQAVSSIGRK